MRIEEIKVKMKSYKDFYGGDFMGVDLIERCETKEELAKIIEEHKVHLEMSLSDAISWLDNFKKTLDL